MPRSTGLMLLAGAISGESFVALCMCRLLLPRCGARARRGPSKRRLRSPKPAGTQRMASSTAAAARCRSLSWQQQPAGQPRSRIPAQGFSRALLRHGLQSFVCNHHASAPDAQYEQSPCPHEVHCSALLVYELPVCQSSALLPGTRG